MTHWLTTYGPEDGEPIGALCYCDIDDDHDDAGNITFPLFPLETDKETKDPSD